VQQPGGHHRRRLVVGASNTATSNGCSIVRCARRRRVW
jgi:hypothetical protein